MNTPITEMEMPRYKSHKTVWALKIAQIIVVGDDGTTDENLIVDVVFEEKRYPTRRVNLGGKPKPQPGWYLVQYEDGYVSFSPAEQFEKGNTLDTSEPIALASDPSLSDYSSFGAEQLANWFTYHPPTPEQLGHYGCLRTAARAFAAIIDAHVPPGADKTATIRKLRECVMSANAAVACTPVGSGGSAANSIEQFRNAVLEARHAGLHSIAEPTASPEAKDSDPALPL
jgi:hypothetical protein